MAEFRMPALGADMEAGTLVEWLDRPGDAVKRGDIVAVVETQKGAIEIEIFQDGTIDRLLAATGEVVPVGTALATLRDAGEAISVAVSEPVSAAPPAPAPTAPAPASPAAGAGAPAAAVVSGPGGRVRASPLARRRAAGLGLSLGGVAGSAAGGAIRLRDVEAVAAAAAAVPRPAKPGLDPAAMRKAIAAAMTRSKREIPHYYLSRTIDVGAVLDWLRRHNAAVPPERRLLPLVPLLKATALALRQNRELNGLYSGDGFEPAEAVHLGCAVALRGGGLVAPALHDVDRLDLQELMQRLRDLVQRVRAGRLRSSEMLDATATVTSLGEDSAESLLPIIYPPQVAIVGFGSILKRPWVVGEAVEPRQVLVATLGADHRASDGRIGGRFLFELDGLLQKPEAL